jgi:hypothetical protein
MGLLIGASALTLCELLDLILYNVLLKCLYRTRKKARTTPVTVWTLEVKKHPDPDQNYSTYA